MMLTLLAGMLAGAAAAITFEVFLLPRLRKFFRRFEFPYC